MERLVRGDRMLDAGNRVAVTRRPARGDQDVGRAHHFAFGQLHRVGVSEQRPALDDGDARLLQDCGVGRLQARYFQILVGDEGRPIEFRVGGGPAVSFRFFGTQPRMTQVPPTRYSSATITRAPCWAAMRAARTPPEPPPMTKRSTS